MTADWYDYPQYYDLAFADETPREVAFLSAAWERYARGPVRRVLEPGCGSGRLIVALAARGYQPLGFDTNARSLDYLRRKLRRRGLRARVFAADMTDFELARPVDAACSTFNTFRHLTSEAAALGHLRAMARALRPGGVFILGLHLLPLDVEESCVERWTARRGQMRVTFTLRVVAFDRRRRQERLRVSLCAARPGGTLRLRTEFDFRLYTPAQFRRLLGQVPELELCDVFDFDYALDEPVEFDDWLTDAVFVLRRRG